MKKLIIFVGIILVILTLAGTYGFIHYKIGFNDEEKIRMEPPFYRTCQLDPIPTSSNATSSEWKTIKSYVIGNNLVSEIYFDQHYTYLRTEVKQVMNYGKYVDYTYVVYTFNIRDSNCEIQSVEFKKAVNKVQVVPPLEGFPPKEVQFIISKSKALELVKQSGVCDSMITNKSDIRLLKSDISLIWKGKAETSEGIKYLFGYAWDWRGEE